MVQQRRQLAQVKHSQFVQCTGEHYVQEPSIPCGRALRQAMADNRLLLDAHPQPARKRVSHSELLLRMSEETGAITGPEEFLGVAERSGLMRDLDRYAVQKAHLRRLGCLAQDLSVNISFRLWLQAPDAWGCTRYIPRPNPVHAVGTLTCPAAGARAPERAVRLADLPGTLAVAEEIPPGPGRLPQETGRILVLTGQLRRHLGLPEAARGFRCHVTFAGLEGWGPGTAELNIGGPVGVQLHR